MNEIEKSVLGSVRLDSDIWDAIRKMPLSLNQYLRKSFSACGVFEGEAPKARKLSKKAAAAEALKASDPLGADRPEIEYGSNELPSGGSVASLDVVGPRVSDGRGKASVETWRIGRKPILKPKEKRS